MTKVFYTLNATLTCKLFGNSFEQLLNGSGISNKRRCHLNSSRRNITHCSFYIVRNPFHEIGTVLILNI